MIVLSGIDTAATLMVFQSALARSASRNKWLQRIGGWEFPTKWFFRIGLLVLVFDAALQLIPLHFLHQLGGFGHQMVHLFMHH